MRRQAIWTCAVLSSTSLMTFISSCSPSFSATLNSSIDGLSASSLELGYLDGRDDASQASLWEDFPSSLGIGYLEGTANDSPFTEATIDEAVFETVFLGNDRLNSLAALQTTQSPQSTSNSNDRGFSLDSLVSTLGQIKLYGNNPGSSPSDVQILPQTDISNIYEGVYAFTPTNFQKSTNYMYMSRDYGTYSVGVFQIASRSNLKGTNGITSPRSFGQTQLISGIKKQGISLKVSQFNSLLPMMPRNNFSLTVKDFDHNISEASQSIDNFGRLQVKVNFALLPQNNLPTPLDLRDDYASTSTLESVMSFANIYVANRQKQVQEEFKERVEERAQQQQAKLQQIQNLFQQRLNTSVAPPIQPVTPQFKQQPSPYKLYPSP